MEYAIKNFNSEDTGSITLNPDIFSVPYRPDILQRVIEWQRAKARSGTHATKTISHVSGTNKKPFKQKGTGRARQGRTRAVQMRGGGIAFGPLPRSYEFRLQKKVRVLGLKIALSHKLREGKLYIVDSMIEEFVKTKQLSNAMKIFSEKSLLIIENPLAEINVSRSAKNLHSVNTLPPIGANVYDIIRHDALLLTREAAMLLEERLK